MSEYYDLQTNILLQADDFVEAYQRCIRGENPEVDEYGRVRSHFIAIPAVVKAAFACELYLKCLNGQYVEEHDLKVLYFKLDTHLQNLIRKYVEAHWTQPNGHSFDDLLERAKDVFVSWRYIFEKEYTDVFMGCYVNEYLSFFELFIAILQKLAHENKGI